MALIMRESNNQFGDIIINDQILFGCWELEQNNITKAFEINNNGVNAISIADTTRITTFENGSINSNSTSMFFAVGLVQQVRWDTIAAFFNRGIIVLGNALSDPTIDTTGTDLRFIFNTNNEVFNISEIGNIVLNGVGTLDSRIQFINSSTGTTSGDGTRMGLTTSTFFINNREATNINFQHSGTTELSIDSAGLVGLSNSSPTYQLDIVGTDIRLDSGSTSEVNLRMDTTNATGRVMFRQDDGDVFVGDIDNNGGALFLRTAGSNRLTIDSAGLVGIAQTTPVALLHLGSDTTTELLRFDIERAWYFIQGGSGSSASLDLTTEITGKSFRVVDETSGNISFTTSASTTASTQFVLLCQDGGKVGIGIDAPISLLHLYENNSTVTTENGITIEQDGTGDAIIQYLLTGGQRWVMGLDNSNSDGFRIASDNNLSTNARFTITTDGNVGLGNFNSAIRLAIGDSDTGIDWVSDGVIEIKSNTNSRIHFNAGAGNIGFGDNTAPAVDFEFEDASDPRMRLTDGRSNYGGSAGVILGTFEFWSNDASISGGGLLAGMTVVSDNGTVFPDGKLEWTLYTDGASDGLIDFENDGSINNSTGTYGMISDVKYKENIVDCNSQWDDIKSMRFRNFNFIGKDVKCLGVIAQELELTSPNLVSDDYRVKRTGNKIVETFTTRSKNNKGEWVEKEITEEVDETEKDEYKSVKQSIMFMKGMVALQEAMLRIEQLEAKVLVLESK